MLNKKRKICVVINNRANYARIKYFLKEAKKLKSLDVNIILGASANLSKYGNLEQTINKDGFRISNKISTIVEGENLISMAKSTALSIIELTSIFERIKPHIVLTVADRFETLATAIASSYMNIFLAHTQGGEVSGSIDENVRHSITKLAHIHFPSTKRSKKFLINLGEHKKNIFLTGCPSIDILKNEKLILDNKLVKEINKLKTNGNIDFKKDYIILMQHPVTTEYNQARKQIDETIKAVKILSKKIQVLWLWPNVDAGSDIFSKQIRIFRERNPNIKNLLFYKNFTPEQYATILKNCSCIVGNSSSGIRESAFLGIPTVNIGTRQNLRETSKNVLHVNYSAKKIISAVMLQKNKKFKKDILYGDGTAGKQIAKILSKCNLDIKKTLNYIKN
ncbi:UDP-N-acetylglucosamine 2-epimerase [Candidatus Pelagibacter sp.]|nr:UDP-N-acetylglucosamine 2-epimerase [Candidatus Pelagibacter sp.]